VQRLNRTATTVVLAGTTVGGSGTENAVSGTLASGADRPRTEAEIVSGTDAPSPGGNAAISPSGQSVGVNAPALETSSTRFRKPLKLAGVGALGGLFLGLSALFASLRAPITAFARQRWLTRFGWGLLLAILAIAAIALARELLASPKSWPRVGLKAVGFSALTAFAFVRRRILRRGVSTLSEILPSTKSVRVPTPSDPLAAIRLIDEQVPKSLRLGDSKTKRSPGRHAPELAQRLRKASKVEALFGFVALLVSGALLLV
jgi:hypothetical protein